MSIRVYPVGCGCHVAAEGLSRRNDRDRADSASADVVADLRSEPQRMSKSTHIQRSVVVTREFTISPRAPFRLDLTAWALGRRAHNAIDRWDGRT
jgi:hypothetical protein